MGAVQSATRSANTPEDDGKPRPYGISANSYLTMDSSIRAVYEGMLSLVRNNQYADLLVICGDDRYPVHRAIVCPRSTYFMDQCAWNDRESPSTSKNIWIDPSECDSDILAAVFAFLYTLDYNAVGKQALTFGVPEEVEDELSGGATLEVHASEFRPLRYSNNFIELVEHDQSNFNSSSTASDGIFTPSEYGSRPLSATLGSQGNPNEKRNELVFHLLVLDAAHRLGIKTLVEVAKAKFTARVYAVQATPEMIGCLRHLYQHRNAGSLAEMKELATQYAKKSFRTLKTCEGWNDLVVDFSEFGAEMLKRF